eukprot:501806_1
MFHQCKGRIDSWTDVQRNTHRKQLKRHLEQTADWQVDTIESLLAQVEDYYNSDKRWKRRKNAKDWMKNKIPNFSLFVVGVKINRIYIAAHTQSLNTCHQYNNSLNLSRVYSSNISTTSNNNSLNL